MSWCVTCLENLGEEIKKDLAILLRHWLNNAFKMVNSRHLKLKPLESITHTLNYITRWLWPRGAKIYKLVNRYVKWSCSVVSYFLRPMDSSLPGSSIFQARILEWAAISFSRRSSQPRDWTRVSHIIGRCFTVWATWEVPKQICKLIAKCKGASQVME